MAINKEKDAEWGRRLQSLRNDKGLSQKELVASEIDLSLPTIQRYEAGELPSAKGINKIVKYFKCGKSWLLSGEGKKYPEADNPETPAPAHYIKEGGAAYAAGAPAQPFSIAEDLILAATVLESRTHYATALHMNIRSFYGALGATTELKVCQDRIADLQDQVDALRREVEGLKAPPVSSDQPAEPLEKVAM